MAAMAKWIMRNWQRLENRWDTRERIERDKRVAEEAVAQTEAQIAERQRDYATLWEMYHVRRESAVAYATYEKAARLVYSKHGRSAREIEFTLLHQNMVDDRPLVSLDDLIAYLERDSWEPNSGYAKMRIIQYLKQRDLSASALARLRQVALHAVDSRDRREFRYFCGLARKVSNPDLRSSLRVRMTMGNKDVQRRAAWMLYTIGERGPELQAYQGWAYRERYRDLLRATERKTKR